MDVVALEKTEEYQGRYRVERTLGAGGMGVVYLAEDIKLGRKVAIKQLRSDMTGNSAEARFRSEAQLLARLNHPNIVRLYDVIEEEHKIALVMELVEGVTLKEWMREHSPTLAEKLDLLMQVSLGLGKAHCLGIIHRDLKPENILVTVDGVAKITDFGIAKALDCDQQLTREDHIAGSVQAMSPEQLQGGRLDARSDLFSLGSIAYELLCGCKPFERGDMSALAFAQQIISKPHIPPQQSWPDIPKPLGALVDRLLGKRPEQRPDSVQQVYEALELIRKHGIDADTQQYSDTVTQLLLKPRKRYRKVTTSFATIVILVVGALWAWHSFMQLTPQYITVLPIKLSGEISGDENSERLVKAMVRQALMNSAGRLKSSALVSFSPREGTPLEQQLKKLQERGITDALFAHLDCMKLRCNIEMQRINPSDSRIKKQVSFAFINDRHQEAQYTIGNSALELFPKSYRKEANSSVLMEPEDYNRYLTIFSKLGSNQALDKDDLDKIEDLTIKYPHNINLFSAYSDVAFTIWVKTNDNNLLTQALRVLARAESSNIGETALLEARLQIKSTGVDKEGFESILHKLQNKKYPSAHLLAQHSRYLYSQGNYSQGLKYAKEATALMPSSGDYLYLAAIHQVAIGDYTSTKKILDDLIERYPSYWAAYALMGVVGLETGNSDIAEKAISAIPSNLRSWRTKSNLGIVYFLKSKYQKALDIYLEILEDSPDNVQMLGQIAETYLLLSDSKQAEKYYQKVLEATERPTDLREKRIRAEALAHIGHIPKAIALIKELIRESPDDTYVKYTAAQVYALAGEWQSANYHVEQLLDQGMSAEWFALKPFQLLCTQSKSNSTRLEIICNN